MTQTELIAIVKAAITTSTGGLVTTQQLNKFITTIIDKSAFLKRVRVERNISVSMQLDRLGIDSRVLRKKVETVAPSTPTGVTRGYETLTPTKVVLYSQLTYEWLQKAIGGSPDLNPDTANEVEKLVYDLLAKQFSNDLVDLGFNGVDASEDLFLTILNGWLYKIANHASAHNDTYLSTDKITDVFNLMLQTLPSEYKVDRSKLNFYVNPNVEDEYRDLLAARSTGLGDILLVKNEPVYYKGIKIDPQWAMPDNEILLTFDENFAIGFGQQMLIERDKDIKAQVIDLMTTCDIDVNVVIADACVYYKMTV